MRLNTLSAVTLLSLSLPASAAPVPKLRSAQREHVPRRAAPYSVVAVDGGSSTASTPTVSTKVQTVTESPQASSPTTTTTSSTESQSQSTSAAGYAASQVTTTIVSTAIVSESASAKTILVTVTTAVNQGAPAAPTPTPAAGPPGGKAIVPGYAPPSGTAGYPASGTFPTAAAGPSGSYDDGQWHSSYPGWNSTAFQKRTYPTAPAGSGYDSFFEKRSYAAAPTGYLAGATAVRRSSPTGGYAGIWNQTSYQARAAQAAGASGSPYYEAGTTPWAAQPSGAVRTGAIYKRSTTDDSNAITTISSSSVASTLSSPPLPTLAAVSVVKAGYTNPTEVPSLDMPVHEHEKLPAAPTTHSVPRHIPEHLREGLAIAKAHASD